MVAKAKSSYKITNWKKYNESLVQRGSITFWFRDDVIEQWEHANERPRVGHPFCLQRYGHRMLADLA